MFTKAKKHLRQIIQILTNNQFLKKHHVEYFISYINNDVIILLCIMLPQTIGYAKHFESNNTMSFKISDNKLLKEYTKTW